MNDHTKIEKIKAAQHLIRAALSLVEEATDDDDHLVTANIKIPLRKLVASRHLMREFTLDDLIHEAECRIGPK